MFRREFLGALCAAPLLAGRNRIGRSRISAITDEIAKTPADAIAFAKQYGLRWVELRSVPGGGKGEYARQSEEFIRQAAREFRDNGLRVSFLNTGMLKYTLPGTEPVRRRPEDDAARARRMAADAARFERRLEELRRAIRTAHIFGVDKLRIFTFLRVAEPEKIHSRTADIIGEMAEIADKEKVRLLIENEGSCNIATCRELVALLQQIPGRAVGINWDPLNGTSREPAFPDGYNMLPKKRIANVQIKGRSLLDEKQRLDWSAIFAALARDGYRGQVGLETHIFGPEQVRKSHESMREILRIVES
ncbi:MAG: sugar phosphate isomerase/epimerase [Acidobacteria bacterium]|nr:sugar phosphate isomerase/epimerase [Acidobacteriota bacterium]